MKIVFIKIFIILFIDSHGKVIILNVFWILKYHVLSLFLLLHWTIKIISVDIKVIDILTEGFLRYIQWKQIVEWFIVMPVFIHNLRIKRILEAIKILRLQTAKVMILLIRTIS